MQTRLLQYTSIVVLFAGLSACGGDDGQALPPAPVVNADTQAPQTWNAIAVQALQNFAAVDPSGGFPSPIDGRILAMAFIAFHDALNATDRRFKPYLTDTSAPSANPVALGQATAKAILDARASDGFAAVDGPYTRRRATPAMTRSRRRTTSPASSTRATSSSSSSRTTRCSAHRHRRP